MDLAVDEQGLWALSGSTGNSKRLYATKIDVYKNTVTRSWSLSTGKHTLPVKTKRGGKQLKIVSSVSRSHSKLCYSLHVIIS